MINDFIKHHRKLLIVALIFGIFIILSFSRHWIRGSVFPWYANQLAGKQVNDATDTTFTDANVLLQKAGLQLTPPSYKVRTCDQVENSYQHITVICTKAIADGNWEYQKPVPQSFVDEWPMIAQTLTQNKLGMSWTVSKNYIDAAPADLFKGLGHNNVAFTKQIGKVQCELDVDVQPAQDGYVADYDINEACTRDVKFFGGY